jgi:hypothetical protein
VQERATRARPAPPPSRVGHAGLRFVAIVALTLFCSAVVPVIPIVLGVLLIVAVAIHVGLPELQPFVDPVLRVPVGRARKRHARLLLMAGGGVLLVASGSVGATVRGELRSRWELRDGQRDLVEGHATELLERARHLLSAGDVDGAELVLLDADAIVGVDPDKKEEIDLLLERVRRSGDSKAILDILTRLPQQDFEAFRTGASVPDAFEFGDKALTYRAVEVARAQIDEAQEVRARR